MDFVIRIVILLVSNSSCRKEAGVPGSGESLDQSLARPACMAPSDGSGIPLLFCRLEATRAANDRTLWHRFAISSKSKFLLLRRNFYQGKPKEASFAAWQKNNTLSR
jgi:hypothetical protein